MNSLRKFLTPLNLHFAGLVLLLGFNLFLLVQLFVAWHEASADRSAEYDSEHMMYLQLQSQMSHLQGLPQKVDQAHVDAGKFYDKRIAPNWSTMAGELGTLVTKDNVRLTRAQYTPAPAVAGGLTEVRVDASVSGEYTQVVHFINDIERDKNDVFFIINTLTLSGQQGGLVNLRLRMTTYLQSSSDLPASTGNAPADGTPQAAMHPPALPSASEVR